MAVGTAQDGQTLVEYGLIILFVAVVPAGTH